MFIHHCDTSHNHITGEGNLSHPFSLLTQNHLASTEQGTIKFSPMVNGLVLAIRSEIRNDALSTVSLTLQMLLINLFWHLNLFSSLQKSDWLILIPIVFFNKMSVSFAGNMALLDKISEQITHCGLLP
jgi:hypothetical protein